MRALLPLILVSAIFASCARILNGPVQKVSLKHSPEFRSLRIDSSVKHIRHEDKTFILRSKAPLIVHLQTADSVYTYTIKARNSLAFWLNAYPGFFIGFLFDFDDHRRYEYPRSSYFVLRDEKVRRRSLPAIEKGTWRAHISLPYINGFTFTTPAEPYDNFGFMGLEGGLDYFDRQDQYMSLSGGAALDVPVPVPAPIRWGEEYRRGSVAYIVLRKHFIYRRLDVGLGLSLLNASWSMRTLHDSVHVENRGSNTCLGLSTSARFRFTEKFAVGVLWQPQFLSFTRAPMMQLNQHFAIEFVWKTVLYSPGKKR